MSRESLLFRRILANDLRLFFRGWEKQRLVLGGGILLQLLVLAFLHLPVFTMVGATVRGGTVAGGTEFACLLMVLLLLAAGLQRCLEVIYNRGDLPLFLASPVPNRVVVLTRLLDILLTTLAGSALFVVPVLDAAVWFAGSHWWWGWLAWVLGAAVFSAAALGLTLFFVQRLGARRARAGVQIIGIFAGLLAFLGFQAPSWMLQSQRVPNLHAAH